MCAPRATSTASASVRSRLRACDERLLLLARTRAHRPRRDRAVARFSRLGEHGAIWIVLGAGGALVDAPRASAWRRAASTVAGVYVLNTSIKLVVRRRRPILPGYPPLTGTQTALSFPSAHAATALAAARLYSGLGLPRVPLYLLAGAFAYSRLYLGVHYPSDVLAGALMGTLVAHAAGGTAPSAVGAPGTSAPPPAEASR